MAGESAYVVRLAAWLARALGSQAPLFERFQTARLGVGLPLAVVEAPAVTTALQQAAASSVRVEEAGAALDALAEADELEVLEGFLRLGVELAAYFAALDELVDAVRAGVTPATVPDPVAREALESFAEQLALRIAEHALASGITRQLPEVAFVLRVLGLLDWRHLPAAGASGVEVEHVRQALELQRIRTLITDPGDHFREALGWGDDSFDPESIFKLAAEFFPGRTDVVAAVEAGEPSLRIGYFSVRRDATVTPPELLLALTAAFEDDREGRVKLSDAWGVGLSSNLRMTGEVSGRVTPPLALELQPPEGEVGGGLQVRFDRNEDAQPFDILAGTGLLTMSATNTTLGVGLDAEWDVDAGAATFDPMVSAAIDGLTLKIGSDDADSFIGGLLSGVEIEGELDLGLEWQASTGLRITASGGIEIALPMHRALGPIELQTLYLALGIEPDGTLALETSAALTGQLGPLSVSVDRLGATLDMRFAEASETRSRPFDVALAFKAPNGIGLAVDAGAVKGGGYLSIDTARGEYAGALELVFSDFLALKAIGIITTQNPDGSPGFSLLIIITAEFATGLQLGFGFTLLGVGGLLGLNRTMRLDALAEGVRGGGVESVLFPRDVIVNAPRIISDLRTYFPPQDGRFLIGPMAKLGWGTPTLVKLTLGIVIEIPGNIAILGVLRVALPDEDAAVVAIQVSFFGAIEFDRKRVYFFASLYDSRILFITLEGEMAALAAFGDDADFVLSVGGFHPRFEPPPLPVPSPRRIALNILDEDNARIRVEGYLAVTTNTAQFGARAEAFFGFSAFSVEGSISFDALLQFSPLHFIIEISASFSLRAFGRSFLGISLRLSLEGPTPWRARGSGSISLLFFKISANFDITWGEERPTELPPVAVMPLLSDELAKPDSWQAQLPPGSSILVSLRALDSDEHALVLHPVGTLRVSQKAVPLDLTVDKIGAQRPADANRFSLEAGVGDLVKRRDVHEQFAPAQFKDYDDAQKLSLPAFEPQPGGVELSAGGAELSSGAIVKRIDRHELITIDTAGRRAALRFQVTPGILFDHFVARGSVARSSLSKATRESLEPFAEKVSVERESFVVARQVDNTLHTPTSTGETMARDQLARAVREDPTLADTLHVIPAFEAVG